MDMSDRWTPVDMRSLPHGLAATEFYNADGNRVGENFEIDQNINYIVQDPKSLVFMENTWWQTSENSIYTSYDYTFDFMGLHYLPFFSSCEGFGSHMHIAKLLEDNYMCNYVASTELTVPVEQFGVFDSNAPFGDSCISKYEDPFNFEAETVRGIEMQCLYEEDIFQVTDGFRWFEMGGGTDDGTTLFYLSKYPVMFKDFRGEKNLEDCETDYNEWPRACPTGEIDPWNVRWGRTFHNMETPEDNEKVGSFGGVGIYPRIVSNHMVPVETASDVALKSQRRIPRKIRLEMQYFQVTKTKRSMVASKLVFQDPCTTYETLAKLRDEAKLNDPPICPCRRTARLDELQRTGMLPEECAMQYEQLPEMSDSTTLSDYGYKLEVVYVPLKWLSLLNLFELDASVYFVFFVIIGGLTVFFGILIYSLTWLTTRVRNPPPFRFFKLMRVVAPSPLIGVFLGSIPAVIGSALIYFWFVVSASKNEDDLENNPSTIAMENLYGDFLDTSMSPDSMKSHRTGRIGTCMIVFGFYLIHLGAKIFVPDTFDELAEDDIRIDSKNNDMELLGDDDEEEEKVVQSLFWRPMFWKRANLILMSWITLLLLLVVWVRLLFCFLLVLLEIISLSLFLILQHIHTHTHTH